MQKLIIFCVAASLSLLFTTPTYAQQASATGPSQESLAQVVAPLVQQQGFSGTILVAQRGQVLFHESYGLGYRPTADTLRNDYHYSIASITKLFTAILILQMVQQEQLDLQTPVVQYLPTFKGKISGTITTRDLLIHTSGLPNEKPKAYAFPTEPVDMVLDVLDDKPEAAQGAFNYNNVDYLLLGLLLEKLSGQPWRTLIQERILTPLNMQETGFLAYGEYPDRFAYTYSYGKRQKPRQDPLFYIENFDAAGCMYSTSADLLKLDQALYTEQLLNPAAYALLAAPGAPELGFASLSVWNYNYPYCSSKPFIMERRGGILGANTVIMRLPETGHTIIILSNTDRFDPDTFGNASNLREALIRAVVP